MTFRSHRTILLLAVLASLIASPVSGRAQARSEGVSVVPFAAVATDGVQLRGHVYLPAGGGPFATVLELSQYWENLDGRSETPEYDGVGNRTHVERFLEEGFAFAAISVRGTGLSGGCHQWGGPQEWRDANTIVETLAAQPWSNGNVGMFGLSYSAWTQYEALAVAPPALKAIVPASGVIDLWSLVTRHGANYGFYAQPSFSAVTIHGADLDHYACTEHAEMLQANAGIAADGAKTSYFHDRDYRQEIAGTKVPVFATNGLSDNEGHIMQFEGLWDLLGGDKRLQLFQAGHGYSTKPGFLDEAVAWLDHYLRAGAQTAQPGVVEYQDDDGEWHTTDRWPPRAKQETIYLSQQDIVGTRGEVVASSQSFSAAKHPCIEILCGGSDAPNNVYTVECFSGGVYASPPLAETVRIAGNFSLDLNVSSDQPGGNLAAMLFHVPADQGCPVFEGKEVRRAIIELRHWKEGGRPQLFPVGSETDVRMVSHPLASVVPAGHRLILVLGNTDEVFPSTYVPHLTVSTSSHDPSAVTLPVVEGRLRFEKHRR